MATIRDMHAEGVRGILRLQEATQSSRLSMDELYAGLALMSKVLRKRQGLTIGDLPEPEQVHPKRLLAELANEFDSTT